jgi:hypothetical protein
VTVNRMFARNGVAFEILPNDRIERVRPAVLGEELKRTLFNTGDRMLDKCRAKFSDCNPLVPECQARTLGVRGYLEAGLIQLPVLPATHPPVHVALPC